MTVPEFDLLLQTREAGPAVSCLSEAHGAAAEAGGAAMLYDPVTGLPTRHLFLDRLAKAISSARRDGRITGVILLSFDRLDEVAVPSRGEPLKLTTAKLLGNLRGTDTVGRLGTATFGIIQYGLRHADDCFAACRRLQKLFAAADDGREPSIGMPSIGVAIADSDHEPAELWLRRAETALHEGQSRQCNFADPVHEARWQDRLKAERELSQALCEEQFELHYLPLVQPATRRIVGLEALVRWRHPVRGLLSPGVFLPMVEACGLTRPFGRWVLRRACADAAAWPSPVLRVMVNVATAQFRQDDLADEVAGALETAGLEPDRLILEITEDALLDAPDTTLPVLNDLRSKGISITLDDFGTGRSSLNVLQWFAFDRIKIDQHLISEIGRHPAAATIARAIIAVGRAMGVRITAEGVDNQQKLDMLTSEGCDEVQGFYFGRPLPNRDLHRMIELIDAYRKKPIWSGTAAAGTGEVQA
jgi:EAL domain-containing protein (putative c-di-GMP-specific phosphodiesterase class I)/GGDEF domain-containing protein